MSVEINNVNNLNQYLNTFISENLALLVDENVYKYFSGHLISSQILIIPAGEDQKCLETVNNIINFLIDSGIDRQGTIIGIGGGVVCDITGFAASIYLRGINFGFLPSTLLAMCDASIGGKNGVNYRSAKNMIGVIKQPAFIGYYLPFLNTLPDKEYNNGMAEVVKHAILDGQSFIDFLKDNHLKILKKEQPLVEDMVKRSYEVKAAIVLEDLYEKDRRRLLNLGHTLGHAIEVNSDFSHGQSVSTGMVMSARIAHRKGLCNQHTVQLIEDLCALFHLPVKINIEAKKLIDSILFDKKRNLNNIDFIIPHEAGQVESISISIDELSDHINSILHE